MKILALEFSSPQRSVTVLQAALGATPSLAEVVETGGPSTQSLGMIEQVLREAQIEREQIDLVAVGLGPGSYTGIRAALALAQGWQLARPVNTVGISSAETIAAQARADGLRGPVAVVIDAQRGEFYLARYELDKTGRHDLAPLHLATHAEVDACQNHGDFLVGPEVDKWFSRSRIVFPRAAILAQLASSRSDYIPAEKLEPLYLRETKFIKAPPPRILPE